MTTMNSFSRIKLAAALLAGALYAGTALAADVKVTLSGDNEVPPVKTAGKGSGTITIADDGAVSGSVTDTGVKGTMAPHSRRGAGCQRTGDRAASPRTATPTRRRPAPSSRRRRWRSSRPATCTSTCTATPTRAARCAGSSSSQRSRSARHASAAGRRRPARSARICLQVPADERVDVVLLDAATAGRARSRSSPRPSAATCRCPSPARW